jgi:protoporphyrinogen oxidase
MHLIDQAACTEKAREQLTDICLKRHRSAMPQRQQEFSDRLAQLQVHLSHEIHSIIANLEAAAIRH